MIDWNIQARARCCQSCEHKFVDRESYHTLLFDEKAGYTRLDVCEACWGQQYGQGATDRKGFVSHWRGVFEEPPVQPEPIKKENAESLLRKLIELNEDRHRAASFILAVMLERKRALKVKAQSRKDGQRVFVYEHPKSGDLFTVVDPNLQLNQLEEVQRTVAHLLEHGLEAPPDAATTAPAADVAATPSPTATDGSSAPVEASASPEPAAAPTSDGETIHVGRL